MSIDPYDDIELYEVDQIEDKIVEMIMLTDKEPNKEEETGTEKDKEKQPCDGLRWFKLKDVKMFI